MSRRRVSTIKTDSCHGRMHGGQSKPKRRFDSEADARVFARTIVTVQLNAYECPDCGSWHLTTKKR